MTGGVLKIARRIWKVGVAGSPVIGRRRGSFSTLLRRPGLRVSSDGVLATKIERKMLASTCLYSLYAWFILVVDIDGDDDDDEGYSDRRRGVAAVALFSLFDNSVAANSRTRIDSLRYIVQADVQLIVERLPKLILRTLRPMCSNMATVYITKHRSRTFYLGRIALAKYTLYSEMVSTERCHASTYYVMVWC